MRKLKVVRLVPVLDFGGVESRIILQSSLIDRERFEFRVCVLGEGGSASEKILESGIPVDILGMDPGVRSLSTTLALHEYLEGVRPDVLHASISEGMFHGALAGTSASVPRIIIEEVGIPNRSRLGSTAFAGLYQLADVVVGVSRATCQVLEDEGCPKEKLQLIYNCAHPKFFVPAQRKATETANFLMVGRLVDVKNHTTLLKAWSRIAAKFPHARLSIVGDGPLDEQLKSLTQRLGIATSVSFLGFRNDIRDMLLESDFFLLPSISEGCSISLVEAMTTKIVPIGSRASGILEVMEGLNGLNVEWSDEDGWVKILQKAIQMEAKEREKIGEAARRLAVQRFSPDVYMSNLTALYSPEVSR